MTTKKHLLEEYNLLLDKIRLVKLLLDIVNSKKEYDFLSKELEELARKASIIHSEIENGVCVINVRICGRIKLSDSKEVKCDECKNICYYDTKADVKESKKCKRICMSCALKRKDLTKSQRELLEKVIK